MHSVKSVSFAVLFDNVWYSFRHGVNFFCICFFSWIVCLFCKYAYLHASFHFLRACFVKSNGICSATESHPLHSCGCLCQRVWVFVFEMRCRSAIQHNVNFITDEHIFNNKNTEIFFLINRLHVRWAVCSIRSSSSRFSIHPSICRLSLIAKTFMNIRDSPLLFSIVCAFVYHFQFSTYVRACAVAIRAALPPPPPLPPSSSPPSSSSHYIWESTVWELSQRLSFNETLSHHSCSINFKWAKFCKCTLCTHNAYA